MCFERSVGSSVPIRRDRALSCEKGNLDGGYDLDSMEARNKNQKPYISRASAARGPLRWALRHGRRRSRGERRCLRRFSRHRCRPRASDGTSPFPPTSCHADRLNDVVISAMSWASKRVMRAMLVWISKVWRSGALVAMRSPKALRPRIVPSILRRVRYSECTTSARPCHDGERRAVSFPAQATILPGANRSSGSGVVLRAKMAERRHRVASAPFVAGQAPAQRCDCSDSPIRLGGIRSRRSRSPVSTGAVTVAAGGNLDNADGPLRYGPCAAGTGPG